MKSYLVFMSNLAPSPGPTPNGARTKDFNDATAAQTFAETEKNNWDLVLVYKRIKEGELEKIEQYQKGRKYKVEKK